MSVTLSPTFPIQPLTTLERLEELDKPDHSAVRIHGSAYDLVEALDDARWPASFFNVERPRCPMVLRIPHVVLCSIESSYKPCIRSEVKIHLHRPDHIEAAIVAVRRMAAGDVMTQGEFTALLQEKVEEATSRLLWGARRRGDRR